MKLLRSVITHSLWMAVLVETVQCGSRYSRESELCPTGCHCQGCVVDCKSRHLHSIPSPFSPDTCSIKLSKNFISSIQAGAFSNLPNLTSVDLSNNRITEVDNKAFTNSPSLSSLSLASNSLQTVETSFFYPIPNIQILDISQNQLKSIPEIRSTGKLKYLYLAGNQLTEFKFGPGYLTATYLTRITLSNNPKVTEIRRDDFKSLSKSTKIANLKLSRCSISSVESGSFLPFSPYLVTLSLSQNPQLNSSTLQTILADFKDSTKLKSLDLSKLGLEGYVNASTFTALGSSSALMKLDLSFNAQMRGIDEGAFDALSDLQVLYITSANLANQPQLSSNQKLTDLDMSYNNFKTLCETRFPKSLTRLRLGRNRITDLRSRVFSRLTSLQVLDLSKNSLVRLETNCLVGLGSLQSLDLSSNTINALPRGVFMSLGSLTSLDLSANNINFINATGKDAFAAMPSLSTLDLSNNAIRSFNPSLFHGMKNLNTLLLMHNHLGLSFSDQLQDYTGFLSRLPRLMVVNMSSNGITVLPKQMISNTSALEVLDLGMNHIYSWDSQQTFQGAVGLKKLLLNTNRLALFNETSFSDLKNLTVLDLGNNPFACTCDMRWFRDWLKTTKVHVNNSHTYTCTSPAKMQGTHLIEFELTTLQCVPIWVWIVSGCFICLLLILIMVCVLYRYRWRIRFALYKCSKSCCYGSKASAYQRLPQTDRPLYAAFFSFCSEDECNNIIEEQILPNIDNDMPDAHAGVYPLIHRIKYVPSRTYLDCLEKALLTSPATVVMLCQHYKEDRQCELELAASLQEEDRRIILVVLDDIVQSRPKLVPVALRVMLNRNEAIEWHRNEQQARLDMLKGKLAEVWAFAGTADTAQNGYGALED